MITTKIMIVEDETIIQCEIETLVASFGYQVIAATDTAESAIELAGNLKPDLILMDITLAGNIDGVEAACLIRSRYFIPTVFITGYSNESIIQRAKSALPLGYINKPVTEHGLKITLELAVHTARIEKERRETQEALSRSEKELKIRNSILEIFLKTDDDRFFGELFETILILLKCPNGIFGYFNPKEQFVVPVLLPGVLQDKCQVSSNELIFEKEWFNEIWREAVQKQVVLFDNQGPFNTPDGHQTIQNILVCPILYQGKVISVIQLANKNGNFEQNDLVMIEMVARQIAPVLNARLEKNRIQQELKKQEQSFRDLVKNLREGIWVINTEALTTFANPKMCEMTGLRLHQMVGKEIYSLISRKDKARLQKAINSCLNGHFETLDLNLIHQNGEDLITSFAISPIIEKEVELIGLLIGVTDITERVKYEKKLKLAKEEAEAASQVKTVFISSMSHELKTPLNSVIGYSELLLNEFFGTLNISQQEYVNSILESGRHLLSLINDILDVSLNEIGSVELHPTNINLKKILDAAIKTLSNAAKKKQIEFEVISLKAEELLSFEADRTKIMQVVINLLENALKFSEKGGEIRIEADRKDNQIVFCVEDFGIGIETDRLEEVFEPFRRVRPINAQNIPGTGLGLSLVKKIVTLHQGVVTAESQGVGKGFRVKVVLPLGQVEQRLNQEISPFTSTEKKSDQGLSHAEAVKINECLEVLIAEDNPQSLTEISSSLKKENFSIASAVNGKQVLQMARAHLPDLIMMDINMPIIDGLDATRVLKSDMLTKNIPIFAMNAVSTPENEKLAKEAGCDACFTKPIDIELLMNTISKQFNINLKKGLKKGFGMAQ